VIDWTPGSVAIQIGPLPLYWYGIAYAVGLAAAYWIMVRQARRFGENAELLGNGLIIVGVAALIGGRLYHVIDQWQLYASDPLKIILPPYSGLGVFGGFVTGGIAFLVLARRWHLSTWRWADIVAPGLFAMQAAGRWGNFFNQELYGPPTNLPWGISIDCVHRVAPYTCDLYPFPATHFQPLFLYESTSALIGAATLVWLSTRPRPWLRVGDLGAISLIWIGGVRFLLEFLRLGNWRLADIPTAQIFGLGLVVVGVAMLWIRRRQGAPTLAPVATGEGRPLDVDGEGMYDVETYGEDDVDDEDAGAEAAEAAGPAMSVEEPPAASSAPKPRAKRPTKTSAKRQAGSTKPPTKRRPPAT
jgi:phosphatidylglycerol:prolipoprotein diacylglycerol transferase